MRIPSGSTDRKCYFVAKDATDLTTRETGLSSFTVVRSRDGSADATYTTPTITEIDASTMPGVYAITIDEDTTIGATHDTEEYCLHITHAGMEPVTRTIELYRPKATEGRTLSVESDGDLTKVNTLDGHTAQTGDSFARIGANGAGLTSVGLADGAITAAKLASDAITAAKVADGAFTAAKFASGAFDAVWSVGTRTLTSISGLGIALASKLTKYVQLLARKDAAIATDNATELTEINANGGSGGGTYANTTDAQEAIRDRGDAAYLTATGFSTHSAADVWAVGTRTLTAFGFSVTVGTNNDKTGYTLTTADKQAFIELCFTYAATATYATADAGSVVKQIADNAGGSALTEAGIAAAVWSAGTRVLTAGTNIVLVKGTGITGFTDIDASGIRTAVGLASPNIDSQLSAINSKTTNLPASPAAVGSAMTLTSAERNSIADAYLDRADAIETGITPRQSMRGCSAILVGLLPSGAGSGTEVFKGIGQNSGGTTRVTFTADEDGNRTAVTLNL